MDAGRACAVSPGKREGRSKIRKTVWLFWYHAGYCELWLKRSRYRRVFIVYGPQSAIRTIRKFHRIPDDVMFPGVENGSWTVEVFSSKAEGFLSWEQMLYTKGGW